MIKTNFKTLICNLQNNLVILEYMYKESYFSTEMEITQ